jgi:hypothetical protein
MPAELLQPTVTDTKSSIAMRCGAAAQLLQEMLPADKTLQIQAFLTSGLVSDDSYARQLLFNRHVARYFADSWHTPLQSPFQFYSPRTSIPVLLDALDKIERGRGTLILVTAASALRQPLEEFTFMERVL